MAIRVRLNHTAAEKQAIARSMRAAHKAGRFSHLSVGTRKCDHCGKKMPAYKGRKYCSPRCAAVATADSRSQKTRKMTDTERRVKAVLKRRIMHHRGRVTMPQLLLWLGCSLREAVARIEEKWKPGMSWENYGKWQIDHVKACAEFQLAIETQAAICFHIENLQPLWRPENQAKENQRKAGK